MILTKDEGRAIAEEWIASWNSGDVDRILSHYTDDFEFSSIFVVESGSEPTGVLKGKQRAAAYWASALERIPRLQFDLREVYIGVNTIAIHYRPMPAKDRLEVHFLDDEGRIQKAIGHYLS